MQSIKCGQIFVEYKRRLSRYEYTSTRPRYIRGAFKTLVTMTLKRLTITNELA